MDFAIDRGAGGVDVRDVEKMGIRAAAEADPQRFSHGRMRAVATREICNLTSQLRPIRALKHGAHAAPVLIEANKLRRTLYGHSQPPEPSDEQALGGVLGEGEHEGEGTQPISN